MPGTQNAIWSTVWVARAKVLGPKYSAAFPGALTGSWISRAAGTSTGASTWDASVTSGVLTHYTTVSVPG